MRLSTRIASTLLAVTPLLAQREDAPKAPHFEVASIKRATAPGDVLPRLLSFAGACGLPYPDRTGSRIVISAATLCGLIRVAYDVGDHQISGIPPELAKAVEANLFTIEARLETGASPSLDEIRLMLQALLAERFQLKVHREPRELSVYALTIAKGGPKWPPCSNPNAESSYTPGRLASCTPPLPWTRIAQMLTREARRPVVDKTGLTATYTFELTWLPENAEPQPDSPPHLLTAIQEQLGLKLEPQRSPVDSIIVDHAEAPSPN